MSSLIFDELPVDILEEISSFLKIKCFARRWRLLKKSTCQDKSTCPIETCISCITNLAKKLDIMQKTQKVRIEDIHILSDVLVHLQENKSLKDVQHLSINASELTFLHLEVISQCSNLTHLSIPRLTEFATSNIAGCLDKLTRLEELNISHSSSLESFHVDNILSQMSRLTCIAMAFTQINDSTLKTLAKACPSLRDLYLGGTNVTDQGIIELLLLKTSIRFLGLHHCEITDEAISHISTFSNLEDLSLSDTKITGASLHNLSRLSSLNHLHLDSCSSLDPVFVLPIANWPNFKTLNLRIDESLNIAPDDMRNMPLLSIESYANDDDDYISDVDVNSDIDEYDEP